MVLRTFMMEVAGVRASVFLPGSMAGCTLDTSATLLVPYRHAYSFCKLKGLAIEMKPYISSSSRLLLELLLEC